MADKKEPPQYVDFALANGEDPDDIAEDMRAIRAMVGMINITNAFYGSPDGSKVEQEAEERLDEMLTKLVQNPQKAGRIISNLLTLVSWVSLGHGTVNEYLSGFGFGHTLVDASDEAQSKEGSQDD